MKYFKPDFELHHFSDITSEWLQQNNIKTIFSDLDSTLASHDRPAGDELTQWITMLKDQGVQLIVASNNSQGRVDRFCEPNGIIGFGKCNKPAASRIEKHMQTVGATKETSLFLGDQLFTDVWCGKRAGMKTALVKPIGQEHEPIQIVLKRKLERWVKSRW
ncbi:YqeG family HAD IIIA-type phosphatase [Alkalihalobacillus sp. MEB130]|uniref:YqeG family HAD IIIA-type phosphatase n=1 Tax=Alkalihalobacillus sp. MEB130 TaxID=2976704 RepID=UPI0028DED4C6|nr:YqeG family HAD IIIA-type phosphatase [Alkalihalobacillus sp. MEB130]MDT8861114.1 YqeG family HAD IIIA-type phosphatase [Alkalihalobacillus sp. MEB130]